MSEIIGLFPTPLMRLDRFIGPELIEPIVAKASAARATANARSTLLSHTEMVRPDQDEDYRAIARLVLPKLALFGRALFGEELRWGIKEMWVNLLETGGAQALHAHANSFVSGIIYFTPVHASSATVFHKALGGGDFSFTNDNRSAQVGPFNARRWIATDIAAGDMILFPSYMLHEVPPNEGGRRVTMAFNAIPERLDSHGYRIRFA